MKHFLKIKRDQMVCQYCDNTCIKGVQDRKRYWWWECKNCNVEFLVSLKGTIDVIEFTSKKENNRFYTINILMKKNKTSIYAWDKFIPDKQLNHSGLYRRLAEQTYTQDLVVGFDQLLEITPQNLESKLKTYLLFL